MDKKKIGIISWLDNLWYHQKAKIIIIGVLVISIGVCIVQCSNKTEPDIYLLYAGPDTLIQSEASKVETLMAEFIPEDYNRDGSITASFKQFQLEYGVSRSQKALDNEMITGKTVVLLLSPAEYQYCLKSGYLASFTDAIGYIPEKATDEYSVELFDLECATEMGIGSLPIDTLVCVAKPNFTDNDDSTESTDERIYKNQLKLFEHMLRHG